MKVEYPQDPVLQAVRGIGVNWDIYNPFPFVVDGVAFTIPKGFRTDLASIPKPAQGITITNDDGRCLMPSLPHDWGYANKGVLPADDGAPRIFTREQIDGILRDGMYACGAGTDLAESFYIAVRAAGWLWWNTRNFSPALAEYDPENTAAIEDADAVERAILNHYGLKRSDQWPALRDEVIAEEGECQYCGATKLLQGHHIMPFHINPALELDKANVICLCMTPGEECHFVQGHKRNWLTYEPNIREICAARQHLKLSAES